MRIYDEYSMPRKGCVADYWLADRSIRKRWYWRAYHDRAGVRQRAYLGVAAELALERLETVAAQLAVAEKPQATSGRPETGRPSALRALGLSPATGVARPQLLATKLYLPQARPDLVAPPIHQTVSFLVDHLPPNLHLVIATREDPPLPLARLRAVLRLVRRAGLRPPGRLATHPGHEWRGDEC